MARIRIYIARHLCTAPRAQKEADALALAGHDVSVHGVAYRPDFSTRDLALAAGRPWSWTPAADYTKPGRRPAWFAARLRHRLAREWFVLTGRVTADLWGYANHALAGHALRQPAELAIVHFEGGLWFGEKLLRAGRRVGVDFDDWFSRDLTPAQRRGRPVAQLERLERLFLQSSAYAFTTSRSLAEAMGRELGAPAPGIIYNTFPASSTPAPAPEPAGDAPVRLHWFSLVIGPDRGLENLFAALPSVPGNWELHLRGEVSAAYRSSLLGRLPAALRARIFFHPTIEAARLPAALAEHEVGLALEVSAIPSRNLTITNKFFHYLQAGLAVVASDTAGHREGLALAPGAVRLFSADQPAALAQAIGQWTTNRSGLRQARVAARAAFHAHLAHEHQAHLYADRAAAALAQPRP